MSEPHRGGGGAPGPGRPPGAERAPREAFEVRPPDPRFARRRRLVAWIAAGVVAVAVAVVLVVVQLNRPDDVAEAPTLEPVPGETVTAPVPTPTVEPVERDTSTAFLAALPSAVLQWAVAGQAPAEDLAWLGALEAYTLTYTDGAQDLTLVAAQWRSPEAAAQHVASADLQGEPLRSAPRTSSSAAPPPAP